MSRSRFFTALIDFALSALNVGFFVAYHRPISVFAAVLCFCFGLLVLAA
jgi:hypothetical protein